MLLPSTVLKQGTVVFTTIRKLPCSVSPLASTVCQREAAVDRDG